MNTRSDYIADWFRTVQSQSKRFPVLFVQLGAAYTPVRLGLPRLGNESFSVADYLNSVSPTEADPPKLTVLHDISILSGSAQRKAGPLRERVMRDLDFGNRFILVSTQGRRSFPPVPGSSLIEDAKVIHGPQVPPELRHDNHKIAALPGYQPDQGTSADILVRAILAEMNSRLLASLEYVTWERRVGPRDSLALLSAANHDDLRSSGLVSVETGQPEWVISDDWRGFRIAIADTVSGLTSAPEEIEDLSRYLWEIERALRLLIGCAARDKLDNNWRKSLFKEAEQKRILESARKDTQQTAVSIADLRDPLEWLTLPELFDLREGKELGSLDIIPHFWRRMSSELVPIRNRIAHNRIPRDGDRDTARKWHTIVMRATGS